MALSNTYMYLIIYAIIFIMFIIAFASQPYFIASSENMSLKIFYTNVTVQVYNEEEKFMIMDRYTDKDMYVILILSIIIFVCFGCSFLTLLLNAKKLNKFFNIIMLLAMIIIIIILHASIYNENSKISKNISKIIGDKNIKIKTTESAGYGLSLTSMILMFLALVSSFIF